MTRKRLLHLHYLLADNWRAVAKMLQWDATLDKLYNLSAVDFSSLLSLPMKKATALHYFLHSVNISTILQYFKENHIDYVTIFDDDYPILLAQAPDPPFVLYIKGNRSILQNERKIAVVGTRNPSPYGLSSLRSILTELLMEDWTIVSGMAYGIDMEAHRCAIKASRQTIAVLGGGFMYIYPQANYTVLQKHPQNVLYVTEYPPDYRPQKWYFPRRNRIISGLSQGVIVGEAKIRSGSFITVDCALEQNREVFAVPGPINANTSAGTNLLIQQGAKMVVSASDITSEF